MKKQQAQELFYGLKQINVSGVKFNYAIAKNISLLKDEVDAINKTIEPTEDFQEVEKERIKLAEKYAEKDEIGKPKTIRNKIGENYVMKDQSSFEKEFETLKTKNKKVYDAREKQIEEYKKLLQEKSDFKPYKIKLADMPENITTEQMGFLFNIIDEK